MATASTIRVKGLAAAIMLPFLVSFPMTSQADEAPLIFPKTLIAATAGAGAAAPTPAAPASAPPTDETSFHGLKFGVGLSLAYPFDRDRGGITEAEVDGAGLVRVAKESKRTPRILLESHYFFPYSGGDGKWFCPQNQKKCGHGPFVAIEAGSNGTSTISAYGLGWMLGFEREQNSSGSWNIGLGYLVRTGVRVLGDGITANSPLPTGDKLRYKEISQAGWMWMTSFSF